MWQHFLKLPFNTLNRSGLPPSTGTGKSSAVRGSAAGSVNIDKQLAHCCLPIDPVKVSQSSANFVKRPHSNTKNSSALQELSMLTSHSSWKCLHRYTAGINQHACSNLKFSYAS